jgi:predicted ATPase/DNA-binding winged helix-turn-helix (wHTH) protein
MPSGNQLLGSLGTSRPSLTIERSRIVEMPAGGLRPVYASGDCEVDFARRELRVLGSPAPVGGRAFEIIGLLAEAAGELVSKDELMVRVWPGAIVEEHTLQVHISAVRKALGPYRAMLKTESGRGYRLLGAWAARRESGSAAPIDPDPVPVPPKAFLSNFPATASSLIGRMGAVEQLRDLLTAYRAVSLTGPGGIGKTILALEVARSVFPTFEGDGWLVELASVSDPGLVPSSLAGALDLKLRGAEMTPEAVARSIGGRKTLLVLDNCEHVIEAVAKLVETLVRLCPRTTILATSREVLRIDGEYVYRVAPLEVPAVEAEPDHILGHGAVELFITRTKALDADFSSHAENLPAIAMICRHLDGVPLAIEFAAARAATLGLQQVVSGLRDRLALLASGRRTALPRHQTLRATFDWSYELLPETEKSLLCRLAVFPGGFTVDAVAAVTSDSVLDPSAATVGVANLASKSLVTRDKAEADPRWSLLETTRAYALQKLVERGEAEAVTRRHATYFRDFFVPALAGFGSQLSNADLVRYGREISNVRAALDWCFSPAGDATIGAELTAAYAPVWMSLSLMSECRERCECALRSLEREPNPNSWVQLRLQIALGSTLIITMGPSEQAQTVLGRALDLAGTLGNLDAQARALSALTAVLVYRGEYSKARDSAERLWQVAYQIADPAIIVVADRLMGTTLLTLGKPREAQRCLERVLQSPVYPEDQRRSIWHHSEHRAMARAMLARALWLQGFVESAHSQARASLEELQGIDHQLSVCRVLYYGLCRIAPMTGDFTAAAQANALLLKIASELDAPFWRTAGSFLEGKLMVERGEFAAGLSALRSAFETCGQTGWRMSYPEFKGTLAQALAGLGQLDEALDAVTEAVAIAAQPDGQVWYLPELLRVKGEVLLRQAADPAAAEACLSQAGEVAREQGALFWELRVALSLARLRVVQGRHSDARQVLTPLLGRFTEGFETADLRSARATLASLPSQ